MIQLEAPTMDTAIKTKHLTKRYHAQTAVKNANLSIQSGKVFSLLGPNGAGKSTMLGMLTTATRPSRGQAWVLGNSIRTQQKKVRSIIGVLFQNSMLDRELTVWANLDFQAKLHGLHGSRKNQLVKQALTLSGLTNRSQLKVRHLSGGMQRRLEIFRALIHQPKILFLDEPTTGLDPEVRKMIWDKLQELKEQDHLTIVLTTHYLDEADILSDEIAIIDQGTIKAQGSPRHLKESLGGDIVKSNLGEVSPELENDLKANFEEMSDFKNDNGQVSFKVKRGETKVPMIVRVLEKNTRRINSFQINKPSLDDVFLSITGHSLKHENNS